ncbi:MAG: FAD-dependent oxidoreductase [Acidimicrobiales bacterium]
MVLRADNLRALDGADVDVFVVGGGINGAVSAAALAGRGVPVALVDRGDFAAVTSQESSNLVWGGFKYLENYELGLVWKLAASRNRLLRAYPSAIGQLRFLATLDESAPFPPLLAAAGAWAYWGLGRFATGRPRYLRPSSIERLEPVVDTSTASAGLEYGDAYLKDNDARFVWGFVRSALDHGAIAANYVALEGASRHHGRWQLELHDLVGGARFRATARVVVNAAGPLVDPLNRSLGVATTHRIVYSKGIHLVVPSLTPSERVLAFFDDTGRLFYVIPMADRSVIGTTDTRTDIPDEPVTDADRTFLLDQINARLDLAAPLGFDDIIAERCGVRPLVVLDDGDDRTTTDWTSLSRKHEIESDRPRSVVTIFGGKLTDCLNVGEEVVEAVADLGVAVGPAHDGWYGEAPATDREAFLAAAGTVGLDRPPLAEREPSVAAGLWRRHGPAAHRVIDAVAVDPRAGEPILTGSDVLRGELPLFADREMIVHLDDFLRRRTTLAMVRRADDLADDPGMAEVCATLGVERPGRTVDR